MLYFAAGCSRAQKHTVKTDSSFDQPGSDPPAEADNNRVKNVNQAFLDSLPPADYPKPARGLATKQGKNLRAMTVSRWAIIGGQQSAFVFFSAQLLRAAKKNWIYTCRKMPRRYTCRHVCREEESNVNISKRGGGFGMVNVNINKRSGGCGMANVNISKRGGGCER